MMVISKMRCIGIILLLSVILWARSLPAHIPIADLRDPHSLKVSIAHRFGRSLGEEKVGTFFGGANVTLNADYLFKRYLLLSIAGYSSVDGGAIQGQWQQSFKDSLFIPTVSVGLYTQETPIGRATNVALSSSVGTLLLNKRLRPSLIIHYNGFHQKLSGALSVEYCIREALYFWSSAGRVQGVQPDYLGDSPWTIMGGVGFKTYAHEFDLALANTNSAGIGSFLMGGTKKDFYVIIRITRSFNVKKQLRQKLH